MSGVYAICKDPDYYMNNFNSISNMIYLEERDFLNDEEIMQYLYA